MSTSEIRGQRVDGDQSSPAKRPLTPAQLPKRIVAGVDGCATGEDSAALGRALADATGAELLLVAIHPDPMVVLAPEFTRAGLHREAERFLHEARSKHAPAARTQIGVGMSVPRELMHIMSRHRCDLLVLGSTRGGQTGQVQVASVTRQLLGQLSRPLAIAPLGFAQAEPHKFSRIAVGYDCGPESRAALGLAAAIAERSGASLEVVAVVDDRLPAHGWPAVPSASASAWESLLEPTRAQLEQTVRAQTEAVQSVTEVRAELGDPAEVLTNLSQGVDLIVIGSRRWGIAAKVLLGRTGERFVNGSRCPVLIAARSRSGGHLLHRLASSRTRS